MATDLDKTQSSSGDQQSDGRLILVVEDNEKNARMIVTMLESAGYKTRLADDGHAGLKLAAEIKPDLILTDLQMPGMDGLEMTRALKQRDDLSSIPVLAVTAHAMEEHRERALAAGCSRFLTKPIRYKALLSEVADALQPTTS